MKRPVDSLTADDFAKFPVWRFTISDSPNETFVMQVRRLPVKRLNGCIVGCQIHLANQTELTGFLGNLDTSNPRMNEHFLTLSVFRSDGAVFHLARYHDFDASVCGPQDLAAFLGLPLEAGQSSVDQTVQLLRGISGGKGLRVGGLMISCSPTRGGTDVRRVRW